VSDVIFSSLRRCSLSAAERLFRNAIVIFLSIRACAPLRQTSIAPRARVVYEYTVPRALF
jgi:hypothetical protein